MTERVAGARSGGGAARSSRTRRPAATGSSRRSTPRGPSRAAGQFYMLADGRLGRGGRAAVPAARLLGRRGARPADDGVRLDFLLEAVGPGTERLAALERGRRPACSPVRSAARSRRRRSSPRAPPGAILVGGGIGIAPLAILRRELAERGRPAAGPARLSRPRPLGRARALRLLRGAARLRGRPRRPPGLRHRPARGDARGRRRRRRAAVYACGPPAMLEAVRAICAERGVPAELAMETPMACGFGACFGCAVPLARRRLHAPLRRRAGRARATRSRRRWSRESGTLTDLGVELCGIELEHPVSTAPGPSTRSPRGGRSATRSIERLPVQRLRLEDDHARAAGGQPAAAALRDRRPG